MTSTTATLPLLSDRIDLWLTFCSDSDKRLLECCDSILSDDEHSRARRFLIERDRTRYVITRALVRDVLSRYAPTPPEHWKFASNAYGRPVIANPGNIERALSFSISRTSELILLGVSRSCSLGVDVESVRPGAGPTLLALAERCFASDEVAALKTTISSDRPGRVIAYWTLKESYIKARGMGSAIPLDSIAFQISDGPRIDCSVRHSIKDRVGQWQFWQVVPVSGYVAAVCVRRHPKTEAMLSMRRIVPLLRDWPKKYRVLRWS